MNTIQLNEKKEYVISEEMFQEIKEKAIEVWREMDIEHLDEQERRHFKRHLSDLTSLSKAMGNTNFSFIYIITSFNLKNKRLIISKLSKTTRNVVRFGFEYLIGQHAYGQQQIEDMFFEEGKL